MANDYYTISNETGTDIGKIYLHHSENSDANTFYINDLGENIYTESSVDVVLNDSPGSVKAFHTLSYEGSQSKIDQLLDTVVGEVTYHDGQYYNLGPDKKGWWISSIETDKQVGSVPEFIEKEGKWFNYIKGIDSDISETTDFGAFDIQGIGLLESISGSTLTFANNVNTSLQIGDTIYFQTTKYSVSGNFTTIDSNSMTKYGEVSGVNGNDVVVNTIVGVSDPVVQNYVLFAKNQIVNKSSLLGYYADIKFKNNSTEKAEIFAVSSEVTESSK
jgi:hypothetical protein